MLEYIIVVSLGDHRRRTETDGGTFCSRGDGRNLVAVGVLSLLVVLFVLIFCYYYSIVVIVPDSGDGRIDARTNGADARSPLICYVHMFMLSLVVIVIAIVIGTINVCIVILTLCRPEPRNLETLGPQALHEPLDPWTPALRPVHLLRVSLLRVLESNSPGDPL